jgi:tellurite resistance protein
LKDKRLEKEQKPNSFSSEDPDNVVISCALSSITYELLPNIMSIIKQSGKLSLPHKIKVYEIMATIVDTKYEFLFSMKRLECEIMPLI